MVRMLRYEMTPHITLAPTQPPTHTPKQQKLVYVYIKQNMIKTGVLCNVGTYPEYNTILLK